MYNGITISGKCWYPLLGVLCLGAAARADEAWGGNRVFNGSFEDGYGGWTSRMGARRTDVEDPAEHVESKVELDDTAAKSGRLSIHLSADENTTWWRAVESTPVPVRPGRRYRFGGWIKTKEVRMEEGQYPNSNIYIQFRNDEDEVVEIEGSPVRATRAIYGTHDWLYVERVVKAPPGATNAVVGCVMTCQGDVWFDDVALHAGRPQDWVEFETPRIVYYFPAETGPPSPGIIAANERYLGQLEGVLDLKEEERIDFYKYESKEQKEEISGSGIMSHLEGREIHSVGWIDRHDMVHLLLNQLGPSAPFVSEGMATYWDTVLGGGDPRADVKDYVERGAILPIERLLDSGVFNRMPPHRVHPLAGSFAGYLIETYGLDMFKELYEKTTPDISWKDLKAKMKVVYGVGYDELEAGWRDYVLSYVAPKGP